MSYVYSGELLPKFYRNLIQEVQLREEQNCCKDEGKRTFGQILQGTVMDMTALAALVEGLLKVTKR